MDGWMDGWMVMLAGWLAGWLVGWFHDMFVCWLVDLTPNQTNPTTIQLRWFMYGAPP
jgi:hypothetical protein